jgi:LysM repeat protein
MISRLIFIIIVALTLMAAGAAVAGKILDKNSIQTDPVTIHTHVVKTGETLWDIAKKYSKPNIDPRPVVYNIKIINNLKSSIIEPGQVLSVPVWEE